jgi:hypothetical protein
MDRNWSENVSQSIIAVKAVCSILSGWLHLKKWLIYITYASIKEEEWKHQTH